MKKINILITGVSSSNSITFIKSLRRQKQIGFNIFGTDIYEKRLSLGSLFCDYVFKIPPAGDINFIPELLKVCKKNRIEILVPIIDEEFPPISKSRDEFRKINTKVMLPTSEVLDICSNKIKFNQFLEAEGFTCAKWYLTKPLLCNFPLIKKPIRGRGSEGITIIHNNKELETDVPKDGYFYQRYIEGPEYTIDTLSDLQGNVLVVVPRIRLEVRNGKSVRAKIVRNKIIEQTARNICTKLKLTGPACLQCIMSEDKKPYFLEVNPRIGSATIITVVAGINIPFLATKILLGMKITESINKIKNGLIMLRYFEEYYPPIK